MELSVGGFNVLDFIIVCIVALGGWNGYRTGFVRQITRLFGAVIAYIVSMWLRPYVAPMIRGLHIFPQNPNGVVGSLLGDFSGALAFALVYIVTFVILRYAAGLIDALFSLPVISFFNRLAGLAVGLALAIVFVYVGALVAHYVKNDKLQTQLHHSVIAQWLNAQHVAWNPVPSKSVHPNG